MVACAHELGIPPNQSVDDIIEMFRGPWLEYGAGLVLESGSRFCGYGYARFGSLRNRDCVHIGLTLGRGFRTAGAHEALTQPLMKLAREVGNRYGLETAVAFYKGCDTIHPPILRDLGFEPDPLPHLGFRHDLASIPARELPPEMALRPLRVPDEIDLLCALQARAFDDLAIQGHPVVRSYFEFQTSLPDFKPEQLCVAEAAGEPVGYVFLSRGRSDDRQCLQLVELGVVPGLRNRGVGSAMICYALQLARRRGLRPLLVGCTGANPVAAAYWRLGFRPDKSRTYVYFTRELDIPTAAG